MTAAAHDFEKRAQRVIGRLEGALRVGRLDEDATKRAITLLEQASEEVCGLRNSLDAVTEAPLTDEQMERVYLRLDGGKRGYPSLWNIRHLVCAIDEVRAIDAKKAAAGSQQ